MILRIHILLFSILIVCGHSAWCQSEASIEQYHYMGSSQPYVYMPVLHLKNARNWYAEARYNYEEMQTFSLYIGKSFILDKRLSCSFTPLLGAVVGKLNAMSTGINVDIEYDDFFFSAQSQYTLSTDKDNYDRFLYSWSELGYGIKKWLYAGISLQQTYSGGDALLESGFVAGFSFKHFTIPLYTFAPFNKERYFIVGINFEWESKKK